MKNLADAAAPAHAIACMTIFLFSSACKNVFSNFGSGCGFVSQIVTNVLYADKMGRSIASRCKNINLIIDLLFSSIIYGDIAGVDCNNFNFE
ncbi:MAG: hypothetical protein HWD59_09880 [Coxiellaceae bacterium]|nr:MAG: hypothetical protein HWD59_09880 [Coxiellaceae bacterium]